VDRHAGLEQPEGRHRLHHQRRLGRPDSSYGKGNAFGARAALGLGTLTLTTGVASYKPDGVSGRTTSVGGVADFRVIGGSLLPIALNLQVGAGTSAKITSGTTYPKVTTVIGAVGLSIPLPTPGISVEPYFSPGIRYRKLEPVTGPSTSATKFGYTLGANIGFGMLGFTPRTTTRTPVPETSRSSDSARTWRSSCRSACEPGSQARLKQLPLGRAVPGAPLAFPGVL